MKFIKENSYDIVRLMIDQLGITVFSLMLYFTTGTVASKRPELGSVLYTVISVLSIVFYFSLLYCTTWDFGAKDRLRVDAGRIPHTPNKGFFLGLTANVLNFLLAILGIFGKGMFMLTRAEAFDGIFAFSNLTLRFITAMYTGLVQVSFSGLSATNGDLSFLLQSICLFILPLMAVGVTQFGYYMGDHGKRIFSSSVSSEKNKRFPF